MFGHHKPSEQRHCLLAKIRHVSGIVLKQWTQKILVLMVKSAVQHVAIKSSHSCLIGLYSRAFLEEITDIKIEKFYHKYDQSKELCIDLKRFFSLKGQVEPNFLQNVIASLVFFSLISFNRPSECTQRKLYEHFCMLCN